MRLYPLAVSVFLLFCAVAFADEPVSTAPLSQFTLTLTPEEVNLAYDALLNVRRPNLQVDPLMVKIQKQVEDQSKSAQEANAKAHAEAVKKDSSAK